MGSGVVFRWVTKRSPSKRSLKNRRTFCPCSTTPRYTEYPTTSPFRFCGEIFPMGTGPDFPVGESRTHYAKQSANLRPPTRPIFSRSVHRLSHVNSLPAILVPGEGLEPTRL